MDLQAIPIPADNLRVRDVDDETVFITETGDEVLSLNAVGSFIWQQIDGQHSLRDILDIVCSEFEVEPDRAETDLRAFIAQLQENELLTLNGGAD